MTGLLFFISFILLLLGDMQESPLVISYAQVILSLSFLIKNYNDYPKNFINPLALYSLLIGISGLIHITAFSLDKYSLLEPYFNYSSPAHYAIAMKILFLGSLFISIGLVISLDNPAYAILPRIYYELPQRFPYLIYVIFLMILFTCSKLGYLPAMGSISSFIQFLPLISVFYMARKGSVEKNSFILNLTIGLVFYLTIFSILYSYLRSEMLMPTFAYFLGVAIGKSSFKTFINIKYVPFYFFIVIFYSYFGVFGDTRSNIGYGTDRLSGLIRIKEESQKDIVIGIENESETQEKTPFTRLSLINQLSQIGKVVEEDGYYGGQTIEYLAYAFIPRFIWPEKPIIASGAWYAYRIGQARLVDGRYTNSVNMTVPGELYLNFGWLGIIIGGTLFGIFIGMLWQSTELYKTHNNFAGTVFALFLLYIATGQMGADLQVLVTLIAYYLIILLISKLGKPKTG